MAFNTDFTRKLSTERIKQFGRSNADFSVTSKMRFVLLGKNVSENSRVGNLILGTDAFESEDPPDKAKYQRSVRVGGRLKKRHVTVINSPQLLQPNISDHQITQTVRECVSLSDPGPHVFILVLQHNDFTEEDRYRVKIVLKEFSTEAIKRTIVITTDEETCVKGAPVKRNELFQRLTLECGGGHLQFKDKKIRSQIFERVKTILKGKYCHETVKDTQKGGSSVDTDDSGPVDSDLSEDEKIDECFQERKKEKSSFSLPSISIPWAKRERSPDGNRPNMSKLNLVVCGRDGALKSSISDLILQQTDRRSKCVRRDVKILKFPAVNQLSEEEVMRQTLLCVSLCDPGVHAFLLVVPVGPFSTEDKSEIEKIQRIFDSREHFAVIFTSEMTVLEPVIDFAKSIIDSGSLCGGRFRVIGLKEPENSRQIPELLEYIENMKTEPYSVQMHIKARENRVRQETEEKYKEELKRMQDEIKELRGAKDEEDDQECLRIVLIGRTGSGKSATGNTILGRKEFQSQSRPVSVTTVCQKGVGEVDGRSVAVVDTPGLFDTTLSHDQVVEEIMKCVSLSSPGPHVFVIVLSVGRFTKEENDTMQLIKKIFGPKAAQFSIVLFTRGDDLDEESIQDYVSKYNCAKLEKLIRDCGDRFLVFNNKGKQNKNQVIQLLNMIEMMITSNTNQYFTNSMYQEAEMSIKKRMEEILTEREREIKVQHEKLRASLETEMENLKKRLEEEKRKADEQRKQRENEFKQKEADLRKEFEQKDNIECKKRVLERKEQLAEEKRQKAQYYQEIEEMRREIEKQRLHYEKLQKDREEEDRKREEKYRQDQEKMKHENECAMEELKKKQEKEIKKRDLDERKRTEQEEKERREWERKIKDAKKETQEEIKRQQREWEDKMKHQMAEREEEERKRKEKHEKELREKQEELQKMRERFEKEREEERQKIEDERQKQRREKEEKEREYEEKKMEMKRHYEQLERERKEEWERKKREEEERREEERKRWERKIEDLKQEQEEEKKRREKEENERKEREEKERDKMKKEYEEKIKDMKKKHEDEARKQAEELNDFRERNEHGQELKKALEEHQKQYELLERLFQHLKEEKNEEVKNLKKEIEDLRNRWCSIM